MSDREVEPLEALRTAVTEFAGSQAQGSVLVDVALVEWEQVVLRRGRRRGASDPVRRATDNFSLSSGLGLIEAAGEYVRRDIWEREETAMSDQIQRLREVAEAATEGPWEHRFDEYGDDWRLGGSEGRLIHTVGPREYSHVALDSEYGPDAEHIATFDPPTVLELLVRLERAEAAVERVRAT